VLVPAPPVWWPLVWLPPGGSCSFWMLAVVLSRASVQVAALEANVRRI